MNLSKILKSPEEFKELKKMLEQDAESEGKGVFFNEEEPESYPVLVKVTEIENMDIGFEIEEDEDSEEMDLEDFMENMEENMFMAESYIYEFTFFTKKELQELLES